MNDPLRMPLKSGVCWARRVCALVVIFLSCFCFAASSSVRAEDVTLAQAMSRTLEHEPSLKVFPLRESVLRAEAETARLRPQFELGADVQNAAGTGAYSGVDRAEVSLSLSSVIELGGKWQARQSLASPRLEQLAVEQRIETLDVLGAVSRDYLQVLTAQEQLKLARDAVAIAKETVDSVARRVQMGASPDAELMRAEAALAQTQLAHTQQSSQLQRAKVALSLHWGKTAPGFNQVRGNLFALGETGSLDHLYQRALHNPSMQSFVTESRLREAELRMAQTANHSNVRWSVGARNFQENNDSALMTSVSVPLFGERRNQGAVAAATMKRDEVALRKFHAGHELYVRLFDAFYQRKEAIDAQNALVTQVLPQLQKAVNATRLAYESGRYSYVEWMAAQQDLLAARQALIDVSVRAHRSQMDIEQLTAEPLLDVGSTPSLTDTGLAQ